VIFGYGPDPSIQKNRLDFSIAECGTVMVSKFGTWSVIGFRIVTPSHVPKINRFEQNPGL
jgi:hypothetical protein